MYKLILSFAFLFSVLFINSCKEDDTVSPDSNTSGIPRIKSIVEKVANDLRTFNFTYKDNLPNTITFNYNNDNNSIFNYKYNSNKDIEKLTVNIKFNGQNNESIVNFYYNNNNIDYSQSIFNGELIFKTHYIYSGNNLTEISASSYEEGKVSETTSHLEFENGRPTIIKIYSVKNNGEMELKKQKKLVYQNGNLVEEYELNQENSQWIISKKYYYDLKKDNAYLSLVNFISPFSNVEVYNKFDFDKNLLIKEEFYEKECKGVKYDTPIITEVIDYTNTYNSNNLLEKVKSLTTANCDQRNIFNSEMTYTWE